VTSDQLVLALATAAFPTVTAIVGILVNNARLSDLQRTVEVRITDTNRHIDDVKDILRGEMLRMEQVLDARLKHLEEHA
jgi:hypothetical protein